MEQKTRGDGTKKVIDSLPPLPQLTLALAYKIAARASTASTLTPPVICFNQFLFTGTKFNISLIIPTPFFAFSLFVSFTFFLF